MGLCRRVCLDRPANGEGFPVGPLRAQCLERSFFVVPAEAAGINLSKHMEVPQGGLDRRRHLWWDLRRFHALR